VIGHLLIHREGVFSNLVGESLTVLTIERGIYENKSRVVPVKRDDVQTTIN
jgi:hypothetical protein